MPGGVDRRHVADDGHGRGRDDDAVDGLPGHLEAEDAPGGQLVAGAGGGGGPEPGVQQADRRGQQARGTLGVPGRTGGDLHPDTRRPARHAQVEHPVGVADRLADGKADLGAGRWARRPLGRLQDAAGPGGGQVPAGEGLGVDPRSVGRRAVDGRIPLGARGPDESDGHVRVPDHRTGGGVDQPAGEAGHAIDADIGRGGERRLRRRRVGRTQQGRAPLGTVGSGRGGPGHQAGCRSDPGGGHTGDDPPSGPGRAVGPVVGSVHSVRYVRCVGGGIVVRSGRLGQHPPRAVPPARVTEPGGTCPSARSPPKG